MPMQSGSDKLIAYQSPPIETRNSAVLHCVNVLQQECTISLMRLYTPVLAVAVRLTLYSDSKHT